MPAGETLTPTQATALRALVNLCSDGGASFSGWQTASGLKKNRLAEAIGALRAGAYFEKVGDDGRGARYVATAKGRAAVGNGDRSGGSGIGPDGPNGPSPNRSGWSGPPTKGDRPDLGPGPNHPDFDPSLDPENPEIVEGVPDSDSGEATGGATLH